MQSRTLPLLIIALFCGLGAAYLAWYYGARNPNDPEVTVLVPKTEIKGMQRLSNPEMFQEIRVKQSKLRGGSQDDVVKNFDDVKSMKNKDYVLAPGQPVYKADLTPATQSGFAYRLDTDEVAQTVRVSPDDAGSGFITVGDKVDIIAKVPSARNEDKIVYKTVFQNIEVLAVNTISGTTADNQPMPPNSLVLRLKRVDAQKMLMYRSLSGHLSVVLRKPGFSEIVALEETEVGRDAGTGAGKADPSENLLASPGDKDKKEATPETAPVNPTNSAPVQPTQPAPPVVAQETKPVVPPQFIEHKTKVVEGNQSKDVTFKLENPEYKKYVKDKDGDIKDSEKPKSDSK
jgi:Flp pilus assembly protein CpaB